MTRLIHRLTQINADLIPDARRFLIPLCFSVSMISIQAGGKILAQTPTEVTFRPVTRAEIPAIRPKLAIYRPRLLPMNAEGGSRYSGTLEVGNGDDTEKIPLFLEGVAEPKLTVQGKTVTLKPTVPGASSEVAEFVGSIPLEVKWKDVSGEKSVACVLEVSWFGMNHPRRSGGGNAFLLYHLITFTGGDVSLNGRPYRAALFDTNYRGDFRGKAKGGATGGATGVLLLLDANGNGSFDIRGEAFDTGQPFNFGGTTYEIANMSADGQHFQLAKSTKSVPEIAPPPDLREGNPAPPFSVKTLEGKTVRFPEDYRGKIVTLIFWASWCGDCQREVPAFTAAYEKLHAQGLEALGVSLDQPAHLADLKTYLKNSRMTWTQTYSGEFWSDKTAYLYGIDWIPTFLLVDGDTGKILASGEAMRPDRMEMTLRTALAKREPKK